MVQKCNYNALSSVFIWLLFPTNLSSLLLKVSVVAADITISGKLFKTLTILGAKENFLTCAVRQL